VNTTNNFCFRLTGFAWLAVIWVFCKIQPAQATEISPLIGFGQENFSFSLNEIGTEKKKIDFQPNISGVSRLAFGYDGFSVGYSFRASDENLDRDQGSTTFSDWQLGYNNPRWGVDAFYQTYKGFYTRSTQALQVYPDLQFQHYGAMVRYALNESEFSVSGLLDQSYPVTVSAGKIFLVGGIRQHRMGTTISLLQQNYAGTGGEDLENFRQLLATSMNLGMGAGKYWVSDSHFFIGALADLLVTYGLYDFRYADHSESRSSYATLSYDLKAGLGYAGESFKTGVGFSVDVTTLNTPDHSNITADANRVLLYIRLVW
jgi:hypothetical protein